MSRDDFDQYDDDRYEIDDKNDNDDSSDRVEDIRNSEGQSKYQFSIVNGQVTGVMEVENGRTEVDRMEWDEKWTYQNGQVIKTERDDGRIEITTYADIDNDGYFTKISETQSQVTSLLNSNIGIEPTNGYESGLFVGEANWIDGYKFDIANGVVTGIVELDEGREQSIQAEWNETWVLQGENVVKSEDYGDFIEATVYSDVNGDGIYTKVLETYESSLPAVTFIAPTDEQMMTASSGAANNLITVFGQEGVADDLYRIYEAAFNRPADASGLGYWISQAQQGETLVKIAEHFVNSQEFSSRYGDFVENDRFVEALYQNILDREPDDSGLQYWVQSLETGQNSKAVVLASFGNSTENIINLADDIAAGIQYSAFVV